MNRLKRAIACLIAVSLLLPAFPASRAANEESVLTGIGHSDTDSVSLSGTARYVTLTVSNDYAAASVDLGSGLNITYDDTKYKSVVVVSAPTAAVCDPDAADGVGYVSVTVSFSDIGDANDAEKSQTVYYVRVIRAQAEAAEFSGVISAKAAIGDTISLSASTFRTNYDQNDGYGIGYLEIRGSNLVVGTLSYSLGSAFGTPIYLDDSGEFGGSLTFEAEASGEVSYYVDAYEKNTLDFVGTAVLTVTVYDVPEIESDFSGAVYKGASLDFSKSDFSSLCDLNGASLESVEITPADDDYGTWYLDSTSLSSGAAHQIDAGDITDLSFRGTAVGTAQFSFRISNAAGYSGTYGSGTIEVSSSALTLSSYVASSDVTPGDTWTVSTSHFSCSPSSLSVSYLKITSIPASSDGYLCLTTALSKDTAGGYPAISANKALTDGAIIPYGYIKYLRLVTKSTAADSSISFAWTATADDTAASATWATAVSYTVDFASGGTVSYDADMNIPLTFDASDFKSEFADGSGYSLSYVTFTLPASTSGKLYYDYDVSTEKGTSVTASTKYYVSSSPNLSSVTFVPAADYVGTVSISYKGYRSNGSYLAGTLEIDVSNSRGGIVSYTVDKNDSLQFDAADFLSAFSDATGESLSYVKFTLPSTSRGKLYYDYTSSSDYDSTVSSSTKYYVYASRYLSYVSFVPHSDYTGTVTIRFTGYTSDGDSYSGKLIVFVVDSPAGIVAYTCAINGAAALSGDDFSDEFISVTGSVLSYVQITPPASASGALYYDYSYDTAKGTKVTASTKYYDGSTPDISDLTFVPAENFTGKVEVKYTVYTAGGASYVGKLKFTVGQGSSGNVAYSTDLNTPVSLRAGDFSSKFYSNTGGLSLSCVSFTPPSSSYGKLYYGYSSSSDYGTAVTSGITYFVNASPYLSDITFVPKTGYSGSFTISYTGYTSDGKGYAGKVSITVGSGSGSVNYETSALDTVTFSTSDFEDAFEDETGETLDYVKFSLPSSSKGTLYYGYSSSSSYTSKVSSSTRYHADSSPYLSRVTFVPNENFCGTVTISYTAYDDDGDSDEETVIITVTGSDGGSVEYETEKNTPVLLDASDFNASFLDATGYTLSYVVFTLPSSSYGRLYYDYSSSSSYGSKVSASTKYYRSSSPKISEITFVPAEDYTGAVSIEYTCYRSGGTAYSGELTVEVNDTQAEIEPFADVGSGYAWAETAISYLHENGIAEGSGGLFYPDRNISRGDFLLMICRAFDLSAASSDNFPDVGVGSYYYDAVAAAKALGIVEGNGGYFYPEAQLSRQDAAVILARTLEVLGKPLDSATADSLSVFSDAGSVSDYAADAMAGLVRAGILYGSNGALNPKSMITRAEMAVILYRVLTAF